MSPKRKSTRRSSKNFSQKQIKFWASVIITVILFFMQQQGKPLSKTGPLEENQAFNDVSVASIYDGDTFKINLNCSLAVYCEKVPVRVRGVDTPEIKGKTDREKKLAQQARLIFLTAAGISIFVCYAM